MHKRPRSERKHSLSIRTFTRVSCVPPPLSIGPAWLRWPRHGALRRHRKAKLRVSFSYRGKPRHRLPLFAFAASLFLLFAQWRKREKNSAGLLFFVFVLINSILKTFMLSCCSTYYVSVLFPTEMTTSVPVLVSTDGPKVTVTVSVASTAGVTTVTVPPIVAVTG